MGCIFLIYVMLAYVLYSKDLELVFKALGILRDEKLKFDVDLDKGYIYINEAEASRFEKTCKLLESIIVPRKCFLRTIEFLIDSDGNIKYGPEGSGITTGTQGLLERIKNTTNVEIMKGFIYYPQRWAFWISGEGFFSIYRFKKELESGKSKATPKVLKYWGILKKLVTIN